MAEHDDATDLETREPVAPHASTRRTLRASTVGRSMFRRVVSVRPRRAGVRRIAVVSIVTALVGAVALPAFASVGSPAEPRTLQQVAAGDAQSLVVASAASPVDLSRSSYSATTADEVAKKKAEDAAAARAAQAAQAAASAPSMNLNMVGPGTGAIRWPLAQIIEIGDGYLARGGEHQGQDLIGPSGSVVFASTSGVVNVSSESYYGYGVTVTIDTVINGQQVTTLYAHMRYGSRQVVSGQQVKVGQPLGIQGNTGNSFGEHLHLEVFINGNRVDPLAWLRANAG